MSNNNIYKICETPDWVDAIDYEQLNREKPDSESPFYYPLLDYQEHIEDELQQFYQRTYQVINDASRIENASLILNELHEGFQRLEIHRLVIHRDGNVINALDEENISAIQRERSLENHITNNKITVSISVDDLRVGDHIEFESTFVETAGIHPFLGRHFSSNYQLAWGCPVTLQRLRITNQSSKALTILDAKHDNGNDDYTHEKIAPSTNFERINHEVIASKIPNSAPNWVWDSFIQVSSETTWTELSNYLYHFYLNNGAIAYDPIDLDQIDQLDWQNTNNDMESQAICLIRFVQNNIRYKGENEGIYTHTPKTPQRTLKKRAGDCKDKSNLLVALLQQIGINASLVLVHSTQGDKIRTHNPSPYHFNHMIVRIEYLGKNFFFDPTIQKQEGDFSHAAELDYGYGLVLQDGDTELTYISRTLSHHVFHLEHTFMLNNQKTEMKVTRTFERNRADNMRSYFSSTENSKIHDEFLNWAKSDTELDLSIEKEITIISDDKVKNKLVTEERYLINNVKKTHNDKRINLLTSFYKEFPVSDNHQYPVRVDLDGKLTHKITIHYKRKPQAEESHETIQNSVFNYSDSVKVINDKSMVFETKVEPLKRWVAVNDCEKHFEAVEKMRQRSVNVFAYSPKSAINSSETRQYVIAFSIVLIYCVFRLLTK